MLAELHPRLPTLVERTAAWIGKRRISSAAVVAAAFGIVAAAIAAVHFDADVPLFDADLHPVQVTEVENALTLWGETFRASGQGTQILVAAPRRRDILLRLTLAGLPRRYIPTSSDVLEDQANALTPQSVIDDRRRSGIQGDLVTGLRRIAGVADATVVLPPANAGDAANDDQRAAPAAAVQLVMQPGQQLSAEAVAGIRRFVASAYPGLSPDRVTVVDGSGAAFGVAASPDPASNKERRLQSAVQSALDAVLGAGASVVRVSVRTVGFEQQSQSTRVIPRGPLSADIVRERGNETGKSFDKERTLHRFAYDTVSERRVTPADAETRLSVAVFLDASRVDGAAHDSITALVRAAAGADLRSGDDVVVQSVPFARESPPPQIAGARPSSQSGAIVSAVLACAIALFGVASLPRVAVRGEVRQHAGYAAARARRLPDPAAADAFKRLEGESPQAAAYVIASLPQHVRIEVLELCTLSRRAAIESFLREH